ncbi:hypothetical protein SESBI_40297 [Sesbania bispinosa]|nr:hypothetical protein SESBI_40297 [Sesbania bispinosa]
MFHDLRSLATLLFRLATENNEEILIAPRVYYLKTGFEEIPHQQMSESPMSPVRKHLSQDSNYLMTRQEIRSREYLKQIKGKVNVD